MSSLLCGCIAISTFQYELKLQNLVMQIIAVFLISLFLCPSSTISHSLYPSSTIPNSSLFGDGIVLISMLGEMDDPSDNLFSWRASNLTTLCLWTGVQCDHVGRVVALNLSSMALEGQLSNQVTNLSALRYLDVSKNYFTGTVPSNISKLKNLEYLDVSTNYLGGRLPGELGNLGNLKMLYLGNLFYWPRNTFDGGIPREIGNLSNLVKLGMDGCGLSGEIPSELGGLKSLKTMSLQGNRLSGEIPSELGRLKNLQAMSLHNNRLTGVIPSELGGLKNLETMSLHGNRLSGVIPSELSGLKNLEAMSLHDNSLTGEIPAELSELNNLRELDLSNNKLTGFVPQRLGVSGKLLQVDVSSNRLNGSIPPKLCKAGRLQILTIHDNSFDGPIPESLGTCNSLVSVNMGKNYLNASIPAGLLYLPKLIGIELDNNFLTGNIPEKINSVSSMLQTMSISNNRLTGSLPSSIDKLSALQDLDVGGNQLTGTIPVEITHCPALRYIDLSENQFKGPIPVRISKMYNLYFLNVSRNHLNESIPTEIQDMGDFSYNNFSGIVVENSWSPNLDPKHFAGNPYLCGPNCNSHVNGSRGKAHLRRGLLLALGPLLFCSLLAMGAVKKGRAIIKARAVKKGGNTMPWEMTTFEKLDFGSDDILDCIKEDNAIGKGGCGIVYRGTMPNGQQIAVKKLMGIGKGSFSDHGFSAEIKTLGKIRHRHIVKLLAFCSNPGTNLLVYEYKPNGSLGELLHGNNGGHLDWDTRYKIAVQTAEGLSYIHHYCPLSILHRDVKSNNILLDSNFEAHVADFGLAKLLHRSGTSEVMSSVAGTFGYIAPEYGYTLKVDQKSDVYSFGVVLLELITGKKPVGESEYEDDMNITGWVKKMTNSKREEVMKTIDPRFISVPVEEAMHIFLVALLCVQQQSARRPTMREVVVMLTYFRPGK